VLAIILMQPPLGVEPRPALETPDAAFAAALDDLLARVPPARRYHTRYLSLAAVPAADRPDFIKAITFTLNSLSFRTTLYKPLEIPGGLLRIDLTGLEWDREARARRLNLLEKQGVKFPDRKKLEDVWELIAAADPYYFANQDQGKGQLFRGWIDPLAEQKLREVSYSSKAVLRADWLLAKLWVEKKFGGFYSRVLLLPATENELYKVLAVDIARVDSEVKLKRGAAVVDSDAVARFNREVQLVPGAFGEVPFVWRTLDFSNEDSDDRDVTRTFAGKAKHDGREIIFSLPNGLHGYYLADGKGNQAAVVPQDIALDRRPDPEIRERNVLNGYKCLDCHGGHDGIWPFSDKVSELAVRRGIGLAVVSHGKGHRPELARDDLEEYYLAGLARQVRSQTESYAEKVKACNGLGGGPNAALVVRHFDRYAWDLVTTAQAAREVGLPPDEARALFRASGVPEGVRLSEGDSVRRGPWERAFPALMQSVEQYPWEKKALRVKAEY
jgi:hypothetical protein